MTARLLRVFSTANGNKKNNRFPQAVVALIAIGPVAANSGRWRVNILQRRFSLIRRYVLGIVLLVPLCFVPGTQTQATVINFDGAGDVTSIDDLMVGTLTYDITFRANTYDFLFGPGTYFSDASSIRTAIIFALNPPPSPGLSAPHIASTFPSEFFIPFADCTTATCPASIASNGVSTFGGLRIFFPGFFGIPARFIWTSTADDWGNFRRMTWAVPTLVVTPVPEPGTLALLGLGLAGIGFSRRKANLLG